MDSINTNIPKKKKTPLKVSGVFALMHGCDSREAELIIHITMIIMPARGPPGFLFLDLDDRGFGG